MPKSRFAAAAILAAALLATRSSFAQALADRLPADTSVYMGWAGSDTVGRAYDASHLKSFLNTLNIPQLIGNGIAEGMAKETNSDRIADGKVVMQLLTDMAKSPTAGYIQSVDFSHIPDTVIPYVGLVSKIGKDEAAALAPKLETIFHRDDKPNSPPHGVKAVDDYLLIYVGNDDMVKRLQGPAPADSLAATDNFKKTLAQLGPVGKNPAVTIYSDGERLIKMWNDLIAVWPNPNTLQMMTASMEGLGFNGIKQMAYAGSFDGANWTEASFVGLKERRIGLMAFMDNKPLPADTFKVIPASATLAGVIRFDGTRLLDDARALAKNLTPQAPGQLDEGLRQLFLFSGVNFQDDLFPGLGDSWVYYTSPDATGVSPRGFTVVNELRDPEKAQRALESAEVLINVLILQRTQSTAQFKEQPLPGVDKVTAHVLALDNATPVWAIKDGTFYFSLSVQGLQKAIEMNSAKPPASILENAQFAELRKKLGQEQVSSFSYNDTAKGAPEMYEWIVQAMTRAAAQNPNQKNPFVLPPLDKLTPDLGPVLHESWSDAEGFHARETGPFPYAGSLSPSTLLMMRASEQAQQRMPGGRGNAQGGGGFGGPGAEGKQGELP